MLVACSSAREPVGQRAGEDDAPTSSASSETLEVEDIRTSEGTASSDVEGETSTGVDPAARVDLTEDGGTPELPLDVCPSLSISLKFGRVGATQAYVRVWDDATSPGQFNVDAEIIYTPGPPPDPDDLLPDALPEEQWDRSATPVASCVVLLRNLPVQCYDVLTTDMVIDPGGNVR